MIDKENLGITIKDSQQILKIMKTEPHLITVQLLKIGISYLKAHKRRVGTDGIAIKIKKYVNRVKVN